MRKSLISLVPALLIAGGSLSFASPPAPDAQSAFAKLRSLAGEWEGKMPDGSKSQVQYQVVSGGSAVVEHFVNDKMGSDNTMVTVYYLDGNRLLLQHYCMAKNQPRMQAESFTPSTGELRLAFLDATGLASPDTGTCTTPPSISSTRTTSARTGSSSKTENRNSPNPLECARRRQCRITCCCSTTILRRGKK